MIGLEQGVNFLRVCCATITAVLLRYRFYGVFFRYHRIAACGLDIFGIRCGAAVVDGQARTGALLLLQELFAALAHDFRGHRHAFLRYAFECVAHVFNPYGQGDCAAEAGAAHAARFVETDIHHAH